MKEEIVIKNKVDAKVKTAKRSRTTDEPTGFLSRLIHFSPSKENIVQNEIKIGNEQIKWNKEEEGRGPRHARDVERTSLTRSCLERVRLLVYFVVAYFYLPAKLRAACQCEPVAAWRDKIEQSFLSILILSFLSSGRRVGTNREKGKGKKKGRWTKAGMSG